METAVTLYKKLRIAEVFETVPEFKVFIFEDAHDITYKAGQYLTLVMFVHGVEVRRSYSITSSPALQEHLTIGVKRVPNGLFSRQLVDHTSPGAELLTTGAGGFFILPENIQQYRQVYFFAAGSGITPCLSLIKTILSTYPEINIVLTYSNLSPETTAFRQELESLQENFPRLKIIFLYSISRDLSTARLYPDLLIKIAREYSVTRFSDILYYICGPVNYMDMCTFTLQGIGVPPANIRKENFIIEGSSAPKILPPDKETHKVSIATKDTYFEIEVTYPDSILSSAKKKGITLPYSCESGRCGSCVAKCVSGEVWLSYNEVLTDKELQQGMVLTCVGHPVNGDVSLLL